MKPISELNILFEEINKLKSKASMSRSQFCAQLMQSDDVHFLEFHFSLLERKKRYFQQDLKWHFGFRQDKEKVHYFLKNKLKGITDQQLREDIEEILDDIGFYSLEEYQQWLADLKNGTRNDKDEFVWAIMKSAYVAFHYSLLNDPDLDEAFKRNLQHSFDEHGEQAEELLLSKLDGDQDKDFQAEIIYMLGQVAKKHIPKTLDYARKLAEHQDDYTRDRAIIVLGWIGTTEDTDILRRHLLSDSHAKCRAWSASSYMQIWLKNKDEQLKQAAFEAYKTALPNEKDYFVLASILVSIQEIGATKLGISKQALNDLDREKIDIAKAKAIRFLDKH